MTRRIFYFALLLTILGTSFQTKAQTISTFAGDGTPGYGADNVAATTTQLNNPYGVAVDPATGNVYIADNANHRIRKVNATTGIITTIAGTGTPGYSGDNGQATAAQIQNPRGITVDPSGNVVFSDYANNRIRKINMTTGVITTIVGIGGSPSYVATDDGAPATNAHMGFPWGVAYNTSGVLYIADNQNCRIRRVSPSGIITTYAGNGNCFVSGDGGPATDARVQYPTGVAVDNAGNLYIGDDGNNRVRKVTSGGIISTLAGSATYGFTGDGGPSTAAQLYLPRAVATDPAGNLYICDMNNNRVRKINIFGIISTFAGNGVATYAGDGGAPTLASLNQTTGVAVDATRGKYYICDNDNNRIRVVDIFNSPYFSNGSHQTVTICEGTVKSLDTLLAIDDIDMGQPETWSLLINPLHGAATVGYSTPSNGSTVTPAGLNYTAPLGFSGVDSFTVRVFDGTYYDTTTVVVNVLANNPTTTITGTDTVCPRFNTALTAAVTGGTWSSTNNAIATVSASGVVWGVTPGVDTIKYQLTNVCGTGTTYYTVTVSDTSVCPGVGVANITAEQEAVSIFPNPNNGRFIVKVASAYNDDVWLTITNVTGQKIRRLKAAANTDTELNLGDQPAGVYTLTVTDSYRQYTRKIVLTR